MSRPTVATRSSLRVPHPLAAGLAKKLRPRVRLLYPELFPPSAQERKAAKNAAILAGEALEAAVVPPAEQSGK